DRAVGLPGAPAGILPADHAQPPATRLVLPAQELLERLVLEKRVAVAADDPPAIGNRPDQGNIALLQDASSIAVAEAEQPVVLWPVLEARFRPRRGFGLVVPLVAEVEAPFVPQIHAELGYVVRCGAAGGLLIRQHDGLLP